MGRAAGTFQDRLVTEFRLAGATTIDDANRVLEDFLPRFNSRFRVPAQKPEAAYRTVDDGIHLEKVSCFKHRRRVARDNTVRYRWRTLQLLPGTDRTSYAGAVVDVLERLDGHPEVHDQGPDISSQEAPPCPSALRGLDGRTAHTPLPHLPTNINSNGLGRKSVPRLATLAPVHHVGKLIAVAGPNGARRVRKPVRPPPRKPTPLQTARWKAKRRGLSTRGIARELGIHRATVKKYMNAKSPPMTRHRPISKDS